MHINSISDFRKALRDGAWAWPGGYPQFFITHDGEALSFEVAKAERRNIIESLASNLRDGWRVVAVDINWEDTELRCAHSGELIESAYGE